MPRKANYGLDYSVDDYDDFTEEFVDDYDYDDSEVPVSKQDIDESRLWRCSICTYDNEERLTVCDICGVLRQPLNNVEISFKFDVPSPDDLVFRGLHSSKNGLKVDVESKRTAAVSSGIEDESLSSTQTELKRVSETMLPFEQRQNPEISNQEVQQPDGNSSVLISEDMSSEDGNTSHESAKPDNTVVRNMSNMSLSNKPVASISRRGKSQTRYEPEKWMLPSKTDKSLSQLNLAIVGHVDSGKSTLSGILLHLLGRISQKEMHKFEKEAKMQGKGSFAYAWALDESPEERERGITMTVAVAYFDTQKHHVVVLDSPGHKDFVPNMISGATQADAAVLVIDAILGAFEAGMDGDKGQTREHAQLIRSFGVDQLIVAVNKMDSVGYSHDRFNSIKSVLAPFLRSCNFKDHSITWVPISAMENQNLVSAPSDSRLSSWYQGPHLLDAIDSLHVPIREIEKPLVLPVCDVVKSSAANQVSVCGKLEAGALRSGIKVLMMPSRETATVRSIERGSKTCNVARAGDNVVATLTGIDVNSVIAGCVLCHPDFPVAVGNHLELRILVLEVKTPLLIGSQLEFHIHHTKEAATVVKMTTLLDSKTGKPTKKTPRCITSKQSGLIEVVLEEPVCVEEFSACRSLGKVFLRSSGRTVAVGVVTKVVNGEHS